MPKFRNLIICCDGTWNKPGQLGSYEPQETNVVKFERALASLKGAQRKHYEGGVGTRAYEALPGGIYGDGLEKRILGCYRFLRNRITDKDWDRDRNRIFLFGFSRGAYTVRRLSGLLSLVGIPKRSADTDLGWQLYRMKDEQGAAKFRA